MMLEAYEIGISLILSDNMSAGLRVVRSELATLEKAIESTRIQLANLKNVAIGASSVRLAEPTTSRPSAAASPAESPEIKDMAVKEDGAATETAQVLPSFDSPPAVNLMSIAAENNASINDSAEPAGPATKPKAAARLSYQNAGSGLLDDAPEPPAPAISPSPQLSAAHPVLRLPAVDSGDETGGLPRKSVVDSGLDRSSPASGPAAPPACEAPPRASAAPNPVHEPESHRLGRVPPQGAEEPPYRASPTPSVSLELHHTGLASFASNVLMPVGDAPAHDGSGIDVRSPGVGSSEMVASRRPQHQIGRFEGVRGHDSRIAGQPEQREQKPAEARPSFADNVVRTLPQDTPRSTQEHFSGLNVVRPAQSSVAPPTRSQPEREATGGDVFLDGTRLGRWLANHFEQEMSKPTAGISGFDPRRNPVWPGVSVGT